jgi:uncharacterized protein YwqG
MIDKRALDAVHFVARQRGTPTVGVEAAVATMLPSIRLLPQAAKEEVLPIGGCRIGGCPDLPASVNWPRLSDAAGENPTDWEDFNYPLQFILQVNLAEVERFDVAKVLPTKGLLSFFFAWDEDGDPGDEVTYILLSGPDGLRRVEAPDDLPAEQRYRPLELKPAVEWTIPSIEDAGLPGEMLDPSRSVYFQNFQHFDFWEEVEELVAKAQGFEDNKKNTGVVHRLLGHPQLIQSPGLADGTELLLQVDSDASSSGHGTAPETGMMWGDCGRLYYLIGDAELSAHRLAEKPWVLVEMG